MLSNRSRDTGPELRLRQILHGSGHRYRVDYRPIPDLNRRADIVFTRQRLAVFVHGCYWHGCPQHYKAPKTNAEFWSGKVARNIARDQDTLARLRNAGWRYVVVWEHESAQLAAERVAEALQDRRQGPSDAP
jgi:DNA mismatch endonuclease (patch repair protein)